MSVTGEQTATDDWDGLAATALASVADAEIPSDVRIPSLPTALTKFLEAAKDPDADFRKLGAIVEQDPGLTLDLLKCVNAAAYVTRNPAKTPTEALVRLGIPRSRNYLMSAGMKSATMGFESRLMNPRNFWNESLQRALFAQKAASQIGADPDMAFMGGLLQDFILPVLTNQFDEDYIRFLREGPAEGMTLPEWEKQTFGWSHTEIGAMVARQWNLSGDLLCAIFYHHDMTFVLQAQEPHVFNLFPDTLAALLPDQLTQEPLGIKRLLDADARSGSFQLGVLSEYVDNQLQLICDGVDQPSRLTPVVENARAQLANAS